MEIFSRFFLCFFQIITFYHYYIYEWILYQMKKKHTAHCWMNIPFFRLFNGKKLENILVVVLIQIYYIIIIIYLINWIGIKIENRNVCLFIHKSLFLSWYIYVCVYKCFVHIFFLLGFLYNDDDDDGDGDQNRHSFSFDLFFFIYFFWLLYRSFDRSICCFWYLFRLFVYKCDQIRII